MPYGYPDFYEYQQGKRMQRYTIVWTLVLIAVVTIIALCVSKAHAGEEIYLTASWYDKASLIKEGTWKRSKGVMANGELFDESALTCASRIYPLGSILLVTAVDSGKSVLVRNTDRIGIRYAGSRIDLSKRAFELLAGDQGLKVGLLSVKVEER